MKIHLSKQKAARAVLLLIGIVSILSISATFFMVGETLYLPLIAHRDLSSNPTATLTPIQTASPTATQSGTPQPPDTLQLMVTPANPEKDWAVTFFAKSYNSAGHPVMQIYPGDNSPESDRIKISKGTIVLAKDIPVISDGGGKYWELVDYQGVEKEVLFLKAADVTKVTLP